MAITTQQREDFADVVQLASVLTVAIEWIRDNLTPEEVFGEEKINEHSCRVVEKYFSADDVFDDDALEDWARRNGWTRVTP